MLTPPNNKPCPRRTNHALPTTSYHHHHTRSYPPLLKEKFGGDIVKDFTKEQSALLKGSADFLGINFYTVRRGGGRLSCSQG